MSELSPAGTAGNLRRKRRFSGIVAQRGRPQQNLTADLRGMYADKPKLLNHEEIRKGEFGGEFSSALGRNTFTMEGREPTVIRDDSNFRGLYFTRSISVQKHDKKPELSAD
jgi:hypothetical protein